MSEFKSFKSLGEAFKGGLRALGTPSLTPVPRYAVIEDMEKALQIAGERYVQHYRDKIENGDPEWEELSSSTQATREYYMEKGVGTSADKPLDFTGQLKEAFDYQVDPFTMTLSVGVKNDTHLHPGGNDAITMEDLLITKEVGTHNEPARPIIFASDKDKFENKVVTDFANYALFGHRVGLVNWKKQV